MALLGSSVDPRLFMQDFSGFTRAADIQAQGMANLGGQIGSGIQKYGEAKAERKKLDAGIKATVTGIESAIKMGKSLGIDVESSLSPFLEKINDPNVSPMEAAAYAQQASNSISNVLNFGVKAQDQASEANRLQLDAAYKNEQLKIAQQNANSRAQTALASGNAPPPTLDVAVKGGTQKMQWDAKKSSYVPINVSGLLESDQSGTEGNLLNLVKGLEGFNPRAYGDYKQTSVGYGTKGTEGEILTEPEAAERLKTELSGHAKRIQDAAKLKGVSLSQNQFDALTSFDFNTGRGADLISRFGDKPEELIAKMQEYTKAGGKELPGLVKRRGIEAALFMTPSNQPALQPESRVGFKADEPQKKFTDATPEQAAERGALAGQFDESGRFYPFRPPTGAEVVTEDGKTTIRFGAGVGKDAAKAAAAEKAQEEQSGERSRAIIGSASKIIPEIQSVLSANPLIARGQQTLGQVLPAGEAGRIASDLETIRVQTSKEEIGKMRASSPTGSAGGTITEKEWPKFENRFGKMEVGMNPTDLVSNVQKTALNQFESVNGTPEDVIKLFNDGKISKPVLNDYIKEYRQTRSMLGIPDSGTGGPGDSWTKYNPSLLRFDRDKQSQLDPKAQEMQNKLDAIKLSQ